MKSLKRQRGLSLIELMIGILLSALLLMGVLQIFDGNRNIMRMQTEFARVQESGRFAMDLLLQEIRMADFWGCALTSASIQNHLDPDDDDYKAGYDDVYGVLTDSNGIGGENNTSGKEFGDLKVVNGTDMLILGGTEDACRGRGNMVPSVNAQAMHVSPKCAVEPGQIVLISNCQSGELMTITTVQGKGNCNGDVEGNKNNEQKKITITHNSGSNDSCDGVVDNLHKPLQRKYGADARILTPYLRTFFVAIDQANPDYGPSLYVSESGVGTQELVPRIENMQIHYGADTNGDDAVDFWGSADDVANMKQILNIRVQLVVASENSVQADDLEITDLDGKTWDYTDRKLRKIYLSSAKVRNRGDM